jgi:hypothetical protein
MSLTHRQLLQSKAIAIENDLRGTLRNFGLKVGMVGMVGKVKFEARIKQDAQSEPPDGASPSAASASWARMWAFSFTSNCSRPACHACGETIGGVRMAGCPPFRPFSGDLVMVVATSELDELLSFRGEARLHRCRSLVVGHELT